MECGGFITVMLKRHCQDYKDGNSQYFIENLVTDYMLVTYSCDGEILDFKTVGHDGRAYFTRIAPKADRHQTSLWSKALWTIVLQSSDTKT